MNEDHAMRIDSKLIVIVALVVSAVGCGEQFSTQEAYAACEDQLGRQSQDTGDEEFAACVSCYEDCGIDCTATAESPVTFECPAE